MSDRAAERTFLFGAFNVNVNPLSVTGTFSESVDSELIKGWYIGCYGNNRYGEYVKPVCRIE